jgi:hypothetical protein
VPPKTTMIVQVENKNGKSILDKFDAKSLDSIVKEIALKKRINENRIRLTRDGKVFMVRETA